MSTRNPMIPGVVIAVLLTVWAVGFTFVVSAAQWYLRKEPIYAEGSRLLLAINPDLPTWERVGPDRLSSAEIVEALGTTNYVTRTYIEKPSAGVDPSQRKVLQFHAAYYTGKADTVPHVPERCFTGAGVQIGPGATKVVTVPLDASRWVRKGEDDRGPIYTIKLRNEYGASIGDATLPRGVENLQLRVTEFLTPNGSAFYAGYFFIANGRAVSSAEGVRLNAFDLSTRYAFYCKVEFTSYQAKSHEELAATAASLLDDLFPDLMRCVPDWGKVERGEIQ